MTHTLPGPDGRELAERLVGIHPDTRVLRTSGYTENVIVHAAAPIRVCDCGGWTDTWFARHGRVFNIAVSPYAEARVEVFPADAGRPPVVIDALNFGDRYAPRRVGGGWDRHPLLEAVLHRFPPPDRASIEVAVRCDVPAGASTGTSAAVAVALVGALDRIRGGALTRREVARQAHAVETDDLKQQSGIQDQICSAMGGVNDIVMSAYPEANVEQIHVPDSVRSELERRLVLVFLGRTHRSSDIHERVIARLMGLGPDCPELDDIRRAAGEAAAAMRAGDLERLGRAMSDNTEAQRRLHPELVCQDAERVIAVARAHGASGWKVNGAGGDGGSLTLMGPQSPAAVARMLAAIQVAVPLGRSIPIALDGHGLRVWTDAD